jgi:hypothetical protein
MTLGRRLVNVPALPIAVIDWLSANKSSAQMNKSLDGGQGYQKIMKARPQKKLLTQNAPLSLFRRAVTPITGQDGGALAPRTWAMNGSRCGGRSAHSKPGEPHLTVIGNRISCE